MIVILGIDGLEHSYVERFGCKNLMQESYGRTDLSEFEQPRTVVIWSSFLAGKNLEKRILAGRDLWGFRLRPEETFFSHFKTHKAIDVPGYNHDAEQHGKERRALKAFFDRKMSLEEYDRMALEWHRKVKEEFFKALAGDYEIVMAYFNAADIIGHLSFGVEPKMRLIYQEFDDIADKTSKTVDGKLLIISDHGMKAVGRFGDHSEHGFWSLNMDWPAGTPKPTEFRAIIESFSP